MNADVALGAIILLAFGVSAALGFGSTLISLGLGALMFPVAELLPVIVLLDVALMSVVLARERAHVEVRQLGTIIPLMIVGAVAGQFAFHVASPRALKLALGLVIAAVSLRELWRLRSKVGPRSMPVALKVSALVGAGVAHGALATGGPPLVAVLAASDLGRRRFRATLAAVWVIMDGLLAIAFTISGDLDERVLRRALPLLPVLVVAGIAGEWLHHRTNERLFRSAVWWLLLAAALALLRP